MCRAYPHDAKMDKHTRQQTKTKSSTATVRVKQRSRQPLTTQGMQQNAMVRAVPIFATQKWANNPGNMLTTTSTTATVQYVPREKRHNCKCYAPPTNVKEDPPGIPEMQKTPRITRNKRNTWVDALVSGMVPCAIAIDALHHAICAASPTSSASSSSSDSEILPRLALTPRPISAPHRRSSVS